MICDYIEQELFELVNHQIGNFWPSGGYCKTITHRLRTLLAVRRRISCAGRALFFKRMARLHSM